MAHIGEIHPELDDHDDGKIRLDMGCGNKKQKGWIGVDIRVVNSHHPEAQWNVKPDIQADITKPLDLPDNYADEIRGIHIVEHFWPWEVQDILVEWVRVLKPGGPLALECPCLEKVLKLMEVPACPPNLTFWALYGDPRHKSPEMMHRWCYSALQLQKLMTAAGLVEVHQEPARFHHPVRDMRVVGFKPIPAPTVIVTDSRGEPIDHHTAD